jgi:hypothetical protein
MAGSTRERAEELQLLRRQVAEAWPETPSKEKVMRALDAMIWEDLQDRLEAD